MIQEEKQLLLQDLCARLPYETRVRYTFAFAGAACITGYSDEVILSFDKLQDFSLSNVGYETRRVVNILPYLRPMSSMTEAELNECVQQSGIRDVECPHWHDLPKEKQFDERLKHSMNMFLVDSRTIDWLNKKMFDYRGLITMGLALKAPENMYNTKTY